MKLRVTASPRGGVESNWRRRGSLERIVQDLNPMPRGWFGDFKHAHIHTSMALDGFTRRRLRALSPAARAAFHSRPH
jgi:hypothetical protein